MDLHVIGVPVVAVVVVHREHVGALLGEDRGQATGGFVDVGRPEGPLGAVGRLAVHARVGVAEELDARDPERLRGTPRLEDPPIRERFARVEEPVVDLAELAAGGDDEDDAVPFGCRAPMIPPVAIASSSGCAWKVTRVKGIA